MNQSRIRYRQLDYTINEFRDELGDWDIPHMGCGPTSIAIILSNYGIKYDPIEIIKKIIVDKNGNFDNTYLKSKGIKYEGLIYCLDRLIKEEKLKIEYEIIKINFNNPEEQKQRIINNIKNGNMAIIHVGPADNYEKYKGLFSRNGHYLVVSDIDENNNFYVINPNKIGDEQIGVPFSYESLIREIYGRKESFNFLVIKNKSGKSLKKLLKNVK